MAIIDDAVAAYRETHTIKGAAASFTRIEEKRGCQETGDIG